MWDDVDEKVGETREKELKSKYWQSMLERGSTTGRFMRTRESAFNLIDPLTGAANERSSVLLQKGLVDIGKKLPCTSDGRQLVSEMEVLVRKREDLLCQIGNEMKRTDNDKMALEALQEEYQKLRNSLEATVNEIRRLKLPLGHRLLNMADKLFSGTLKSFKFPAYNLRLSSSSNIDVTVKNSAASIMDSYVSGPHSMDPEFQRNLPQADLHPGTVFKDSVNPTHQLSTPDPTSCTPLPNDFKILSADEQRPEPTRSESQSANLNLSTTEEHAQDNAVSQNSQNNTMLTTNHPSLGLKPLLPTPPVTVIQLPADPVSEVRSHRIDKEASSFRSQEVRD